MNLDASLNGGDNDARAATTVVSGTATIDDVRRVLAEHPDAPLIVDLDETLVLTPTTAAFIDHARPASFAAVGLRVLDRLRPWRVSGGGPADREWFQVLSVIALSPLTLPMWRRTSRRWLDSCRNDTLLDLVKAHRGPVVVATRGFTPIVRPVVRRLGLDVETMSSCQLHRWRGGRDLSKSEMLARSSSAAHVADAIVITDSMDDADLLDLAAWPLLVTWPNAHRPEPLADAYIPFRYVHETKPPRGSFIQVAWITDDLYVVLLAFAAWSWWFPMTAIGLVAASMSLWVMYEAGYHENDVLGAAKESDPVLPPNFEEMRDAVGRWDPWGWALGLSAVAAPFLVADNLSTAALLGTTAAWFGVVAGVRATFAIFNRLPKRHRVVPHLVLQVGKYLGYAAVVPIAGPVGVGLVAGQIAYRWIPYVIYRWTSRGLPDVELEEARLAVFAAVAAAGIAIVGPSVGQLTLFAATGLLLGRRTLRGLRRASRSR